MTTNRIDLDAELGFDDDAPLHIKKIRLLGRDWRIICDVNSFAMAQIAEDAGAGMVQFILNLVVEEERADFAKALSGARNLDGEKLGLLLAKLIEVAAERPTEPPSPSPRTAKKSTSVRKSAGA